MNAELGVRNGKSEESSARTVVHGKEKLKEGELMGDSSLPKKEKLDEVVDFSGVAK